MKIDKHTLGLSAKFAVASELCRRNIYAQLTLGLRKRIDLLVETESKMLRIQVKGKQGAEWPNLKGISGKDIFLVLVDYFGKRIDERADFYILTPKDWMDYVKSQVQFFRERGKKVEIDKEGVPIWVDQIKHGEPYRGIGIKAREVQKHREKWNKILKKVKVKVQ